MVRLSPLLVLWEVPCPQFLPSPTGSPPCGLLSPLRHSGILSLRYSQLRKGHNAHIRSLFRRGGRVNCWSSGWWDPPGVWRRRPQCPQGVGLAACILSLCGGRTGGWLLGGSWWPPASLGSAGTSSLPYTILGVPGPRALVPELKLLLS